ncbi:MAG: acetate/propionate family kinase [Novosphingobium sp.]|nr:acetate/propionate family kinase [Novosphingobium sp.]
MSGAILSVNSGSSSIKFGLFDVVDGQPELSARGKLEKIGISPRLEIRDREDATIASREWAGQSDLTHEDLLENLFDWAPDNLPRREIAAIGHRVVHGGTEFTRPILIDDDALEKLDGLCALAPLHQPDNLAAIRAMARLAPGMPQVACFDTAFHATMPAVASRIALPRRFAEQGIRRYGFHGLSYEYVAARLHELDPELARGRVIAAHLGNGASMCAMLDGRSVDTTMGFTALDGLVMGTRCGTLDPGVVLHLVQHEGLSASEAEDLLYRESGLLGLSASSSDMRALHASEDPQAVEAVETFVWSAAHHAAALCASLGGLDAMVFTAGIGENDPLIRAAIAARLEWLGVVVDEAANQRNAQVISAPQSKVAMLVIPTDEESMIARHTLSLASAGV